MKKYLTSFDIDNFDVKCNAISPSFLTTKKILESYINTKDKKYYIYRLSDLKYLISDVHDDTHNNIPKMFTKFQTYNFDELVEYISNDYKAYDGYVSSKNIDEFIEFIEFIEKIKRKNCNYKIENFSKAMKQHVISVHSKVLNNKLSYLLSVKYRDTYDYVNGEPIRHGMKPLMTEYEFESCDVDTIIDKFNETYDKYTELDGTNLTWSDVLDSVVYNDLLELSSSEINKKHLFYIETFGKYFSNLTEKQNINIFVNNVWSYEFLYSYIWISTEFFKTVSYDSNIETGEFAKYFDLYAKHHGIDTARESDDTFRLSLCNKPPKIKDDDLVLHLTI